MAVYSEIMPRSTSRADLLAAVPDMAPGRLGQAEPSSPFIVTVVLCRVLQLQLLAERLGE